MQDLTADKRRYRNLCIVGFACFCIEFCMSFTIHHYVVLGVRV